MRILLSGGGTAGHINPAIAIAKYALEKDKDTKVLFVGTKKGLESTLVPKENFNIEYVDVEGLSGGLSIKNAISAAKLAVATLKSAAIMKRFNPDIVVGTGGYVCVSSVLAAKLLKIPAVVHEQNVFPGSAVKFLANKCAATLISFEESRRYLDGVSNIVLTGNPIRPAILKGTKEFCVSSLGIKTQKLILAFGGSLGAKRINDVMVEFIKKNRNLSDVTVYFATGKSDFDRVKVALEKVDNPNIKVVEYIDNMDMVMNAADVILCRSGAITLAEICALGKPAVLIPSPNVTNNHQEYNARALSDRGAAITITEKDFGVSSLEDAMFRIINDDDFARNMSQKSRSMGITDACKKIYDIMERLAK